MSSYFVGNILKSKWKILFKRVGNLCTNYNIQKRINNYLYTTTK